MGRFLRMVLASAMSFGLGGLATAADMAVKARPVAEPALASTWTGFYVGINGGWLASNSNALTNVGTDTGFGGLGSGINLGLLPVGLTGFRENGGMVGGTAGYNWQVNPNWVVGLEGDIDWVSAKRSFNTGFRAVTFIPVASAYSRELDWFGTFRGRVGVAVAPSFLIYGTGGLAVGQIKVGNQFICPACAPPSTTEASTANTNTTTAAGWTVGAGAEWKFAPAWSVKAEYLYADLGTHSSLITYTYGAATSTLRSSVHDTFSMARVGLNYSFGGPVVARY